jgi:hypothetical protein
MIAPSAGSGPGPAGTATAAGPPIDASSSALLDRAAFQPRLGGFAQGGQ